MRAASREQQRTPWHSVRSHEMLLKDKLRTLSYKKAIERNVGKRDVVLDIGCGTGILSMFAAKKGCRKVYAVENTSIIKTAAETARRNGLERSIEFVKSDILKYKPKERIDVLLHELIGCHIWEEDVVRSVSYIRDRFMSTKGRIVPYKIDVFMVPVCYRSDLEKAMAFWSRKHYGIDFGNARTDLFTQGLWAFSSPYSIDLDDRTTFLCPQKLVHTIDFRTVTGLPKQISASFRLKKGSRLAGVCMFLDVHLDRQTRFSTRPRKNHTHWGQIFFPCIERRPVRRDSTLDFTFLPQIRPQDWKFRFEMEPQGQSR